MRSNEHDAGREDHAPPVQLVGGRAHESTVRHPDLGRAGPRGAYEAYLYKLAAIEVTRR
jgi:hypothetical protein